jgi:hypothetical protein
MTDTVVIAEGSDENSGYRFSWGLAFAGGVSATAVIFFLLTLGSGFGLMLVHPMSHAGPSAPAFLTGGALYFLAAQAFGFAVGGHLVGRLLGPIVESPIQEDFRAAAHGFVAWAVTVLATLTMLALAGLTAASTGATTAALYGTTPATKASGTTPTAYLVDVPFRPSEAMAAKQASSVQTPPATAGDSAGTAPNAAPATDNTATAQSTSMPMASPAAPSAGSDAARGEAARILNAGLVRGEQIAPDDRTRLISLVSTNAGVDSSEAGARIDHMQADIQDKTKRAAETARKVASYTSLWIAASLLFGAVLAAFAAIMARHEDDRDATGVG